MRPVDFENRPAWQRDKKEFDRAKRAEKETAIANTADKGFGYRLISTAFKVVILFIVVTLVLFVIRSWSSGY